MEKRSGNKNSSTIKAEENFESFGRERLIASIPPVVVAIVRVNVPLAVVGVPVDVDDAGDLSYPRPSVPPPAESRQIEFYTRPQSLPAKDTNFNKVFMER